MKIAYLHGLESSIDPKDPKIVWLNDNFKSVYTPKIDYKKKGAFSTILRTIKNMDPHYIVGSSMGGYFAYLIGSKLGIKTILFNPAVVGRSFDPFVDDIDTKGRNGHNLFLGKSDNVINGDDVRKFFGDSGMANVNTEYYNGGHRVPVDVFINSIKKVSGVNEIYNNIQNKHRVMKKFEQFVNEKTSFSQMKKDSKTKEYKEVSQAINNAEEVADIWNMLDPKMFKFTESEFEDIFDEWWNNISSYDSIPDFSRNATWEDAHSLYLHLLPYVSESVVTEGKTSAVYTDPNTGKKYDLQYVSTKKRWELDVMKKGASIYSSAITTIKRDTLAEIQEWLDGYNIDSSWTKGLSESVVTEKREDVGKYNTVKKVIAELGRRPSEQDLATFINNNYYDVTEVERGDDDPTANDKIADLVGFYKFDIEDWETAWADAQNESVVTEAKRAGLSKKETLKVAQKFAAAIAEVDGVKVTVSKDYEEDSFDLDYDGDEYAGGSYIINADGSVVNMAVRTRPTVGTKDDDVKTIVKFMKKHYGKLAKESVVTEARFNYKETGLSGQNLKDVKDGITGIKNALKRGNESAVISNYDLVQQRLQQYGGPDANNFLEKIKQLAGLDESVANEAFSRMSKDAIGNELYAASQELSKYYDWLKAGNDSGKGKTLDSVIALLKKCKSSIKRFNKPEEVKGTAFESFVNEAEDYKYKKNVKLAFDTINDEMFKFRHSLGIKTLTNKDMKLKKKVEVLANVIFDLEKEMKADGLSESKQHSLQTNKINESETVYHKYDFEGMWAQKLGMTREEYVAHFATMTVGVDESSAKDYNGIQFDVKGINFTYTDVGRFYGASVYDVPKTANVSKRAKFSLSEITQFLASIGIKDEVPVRYDTKDLDKICKKLAKKGIVCDHDDSMDVS